MVAPIRFVLNGEPVETTCRADRTLLEWLRGEAALRGTKEGCAEGDCGACSVLVKRHASGRTREPFRPTNSCIALMGQMDGASVVTVEGLATLGENGHPIQLEMEKNGSSQCGFCTPGIVVALAGLIEAKAEPNESEIHDALAGNLCRCTGYRPIVEAAQAAARETRIPLPKIKAAPGQDEIGIQESRFLCPKDLEQLTRLRAENPDAILVSGATDLGLDVSHARSRWPLAISTRDVAQMRSIEKADGWLHVGASVTWEEMLPHIAKLWPSFATLIRRFGSVQIRTAGTIGGNLGTASPIGDGAPALLALGATLRLTSDNRSRDVALSDYFLDYRKTLLQPDEVIERISIPLPKRGEDLRVYKVSKRYDQDISTVCGAFWLRCSKQRIEEARVAFGGMAAVPMRCLPAEEVARGRTLDENLGDEIARAIAATFSPMGDQRGTADYRIRVAANLAHRLVHDLAGETVEVMAL